MRSLRSMCVQRGRDPSTLQSMVSIDTFWGGAGSPGFYAKFSGEDGDARAASGTPLETALHEYDHLGVGLVILRFPGDALCADLSILERASSLSF